ncbi:hypothetical protein V1477_003978 [Vespula maculifrons]|uniref:Uncharacterized protein n=1 Tax=Vespula maculifrons TaxID=7453 RepID=A0ABD2CV88_VESMC
MELRKYPPFADGDDLPVPPSSPSFSLRSWFPLVTLIVPFGLVFPNVVDRGMIVQDEGHLKSLGIGYSMCPRGSINSTCYGISIDSTIHPPVVEAYYEGQSVSWHVVTRRRTSPWYLRSEVDLTIASWWRVRPDLEPNAIGAITNN